MCPGGVRPAGLVGGGDPEVLLAVAVSEAVARDVALPDGAGAEPADGEGDREKAKRRGNSSKHNHFALLVTKAFHFSESL